MTDSLAGRVDILVTEADGDLQVGSFAYATKNVEPRFHSLEAELTVIEFFAPVEYSLKKQKYVF